MNGKAKCSICDKWDETYNLPVCRYDDGEVWAMRAHRKCVDAFTENHTGRETWKAPAPRTGLMDMRP